MVAEDGYYKLVPDSLYPVLDLMYRSACVQHNRMLNRAELQAHGIQFDLQTLLEDYQQKKKHNTVNRALGRIAARLREIGRRYTSKTTLDRPLQEEQEQNQEESDEEHQ